MHWVAVVGSSRGSFQLVQALQRLRESARVRTYAFAFILIIFYSVAAAAAFQGFYIKWGMHDGVPARSLVTMIDGTAERPYVFRQLLPRIAEAAVQALPDNLAAKLDEKVRTSKENLTLTGKDSTKPGYALQYRLVFYMSYLSLFAMMFMLRSLILDVGVGKSAATITPVAFALMVPILQTRGGYFYDYPELLAFTLCIRFAMRGQIIPLLLIAAPATMNKEAFLFFSMTLLPVLMIRRKLIPSLATVGAMVLISGVTYLWVRSAYAGNGGGNALFWLPQTIWFYLNPVNLLLVESTYSVLLFKGYGIVMFAWFALVVALGWKGMPTWLHRHVILAALINVPLFFLFCAGGEIRNLSMLFIGMAITSAAAVQGWLGRDESLVASSDPARS
ncbi:MAG: rane protein of unknown function [Caulobacteraceae bacterium]|nr:rane protein of unknown function [Caulobacteraceae bacterium]